MRAWWRKSREKAPDTAQIVLPPGPRLGDLVIEAVGLDKGFGDHLLIDGLSFKLPPGGIVGVIGPNGAGKSTLFRMIVGQEPVDSGSLRAGDTVKLGYVDQSRDALGAQKTVWEEISGGLDEIDLGRRKMPSRAYCALFNFRGPDQQKKVGQLSGGERNRVHLAKMLKTGANLLLLDEPTNDLDVDTLRALEEALLEYPGCAVVITHDRWFLDRIATHILAFEGESQVLWFEGNYADYEADRRPPPRCGGRPAAPHPLQAAEPVILPSPAQRGREGPAKREGGGASGRGSVQAEAPPPQHSPASGRGNARQRAAALAVFCRISVRRPPTVPPLRWITAANSERWVTAMLTPSTVTSLIL